MASNSSGSTMTSPYPMIPVRDAIEAVLREATPLSGEDVPITNALGRYAFEDVTAIRQLPACKTSVMDGFAVASGNRTGEHKIIDVIFAGHKPTVSKVGISTCAYITTGAPLPPGADAVIKIEDTKLSVDRDSSQGKISELSSVVLLKSAQSGEYVRQIGSDIKMGDKLLSRGEKLTPAAIGLLASNGFSHVRVFIRPTVLILSTGDELMKPPEEIHSSNIKKEISDPQLIFDSNGPMLSALVEACGGEAKQLEILRDKDEKKIQKILTGFSEKNNYDVIVTSGGVSMGDADPIKNSLKNGGAQVHFGRMCMKPGKPTTFATMKGPKSEKRLIFSLPGNPVSCAVTFELLVATALRKLSGDPNPAPDYSVSADLAEPFRMDPVRPEYHRVRISWDGKASRFLASSTGRQASSRLLSMRGANALLLIPKGSGLLPVGTTLPVIALQCPPNIPHPPIPISDVSNKREVKSQNLVSTSLKSPSIKFAILNASKQIESVEFDSLVAELTTIGVQSRIFINLACDASIEIVKSYLDLLRKTSGIDVLLIISESGHSSSDKIPDIVQTTLEKSAPALTHAMWRAINAMTCTIDIKYTPQRVIVGTAGNTLIIAIPGVSVGVVHRIMKDTLPILRMIVKELRK
mmetsp:Transcript_9464/g.14190  ORF Transcript_9464/g.14190 Transcript_9464/m.14190 type:complete len:636 (+) Transcript_9464:32-1939(+)